ncbi:glutathione S-transferase C-terminal domain-containing protein [Erwinia sp. MMLR14_017]|uniref:glutathione S-transferase family protein n=1 Tax=Erwinia sp. MMLR14_017 TaxID=3093842 RepID=UPI00298F9E03|nr:glutathione S-transferase C-terminal domain-containing protein [Erwinia sp. MMLR14_017]MDW8844606.1 glutathione S-transferase C-terminal domain-containing protein [Erwinia sp. MMLR14_017]
MLVNGKWTAEWHPVQATDEKGGFVRQTSSFRHWITPDGAAGVTGNAGFIAEPGRYHLYVALICPWASRTLIARKLKGLEDVVSVSVVEPWLLDEGWHFGDYPGADRDTLNNAEWIHQLYTLADDTFTGRATVPVLWDKKTHTIVNNESADIVRMFNSGFGKLARTDIDLCPPSLQSEIESLNAEIYPLLNNGVYRAGFATTQVSYAEAVKDVFGMLDKLELRFADGRDFLCGDAFTEADIRLFVTLIRFDAAYYGLFKCNLRQLREYAHLDRYTRRVLTIPSISSTVNIDHIKQGYYSIRTLNPAGIVPEGPDMRAYALEEK